MNSGGWKGIWRYWPAHLEVFDFIRHVLVKSRDALAKYMQRLVLCLMVVDRSYCKGGARIYDTVGGSAV